MTPASRPWLTLFCTSVARLDTVICTSRVDVGDGGPGTHSHRQSRTFRASASAARVGRTAGCRTGSSLGVLAVLSRAEPCLSKASYAGLARLPGRGLASAGGALSGPCPG